MCDFCGWPDLESFTSLTGEHFTLHVLAEVGRGRSDPGGPDVANHAAARLEHPAFACGAPQGGPVRLLARVREVVQESARRRVPADDLVEGEVAGQRARRAEVSKELVGEDLHQALHDQEGKTPDGRPDPREEPQWTSA